jgi:beta-exotoxin I transport system ATP-binding protein
VNEAAITIERLTKRFGATVAVRDLTMDVRHGEVVGFLGPNGAGKTTTIRLLLGFLRPTAGRCRVLGGSLAREVGLRGRVGYLPGDLKVDPGVTGERLFAWFGRLRGGPDPARVAALIERLDLDPSRRFGSLSKGNRQKVGLVLAFLHDPDVLLLDEPTSGLDPLAQREFLRLLAEAAERGAAVLFSSHVLSEVEHAAGRVAIIRQGRLVTTATMGELLDRARHRLELRYASPPSAGFLQGVPGVTHREIVGSTALVTVDGPVGPALHAASKEPGLLRIRNAGDELEEMFVSLYEQQPAEVG